MKKVVILGALCIVALASCKKDYKCTCNEKEVYGSDVDLYEYSYFVEGANKTQAQAACNEATLKVEESGYSFQRTCELSKK